MDLDVFRAEPGAELEQGDILEFCPAGSISKLRLVREWSAPKGKPDQNPLTAFLYTEPFPATFEGREAPKEPLWKRKPHELIVLEGTRRRCMVLSDSCIVIEKSKNQTKAVTDRKPQPWPIHVAPLKDWPSPTEMTTVDGKAISKSELLEQDRIHRYLPVPSLRRPDGVEIFPRCYVDLRYATPVKLNILETFEKIASLSETGLAVLQRKMFTFFSGIRLPKTVTCPNCSEPHSLDDLLLREEG